MLSQFGRLTSFECVTQALVDLDDTFLLPDRLRAMLNFLPVESEVGLSHGRAATLVARLRLCLLLSCPCLLLLGRSAPQQCAPHMPCFSAD